MVGPVDDSTDRAESFHGALQNGGRYILRLDEFRNNSVTRCAFSFLQYQNELNVETGFIASQIITQAAVLPFSALEAKPSEGTWKEHMNPFSRDSITNPLTPAPPEVLVQIPEKGSLGAGRVIVPIILSSSRVPHNQPLFRVCFLDLSQRLVRRHAFLVPILSFPGSSRSLDVGVQVLSYASSRLEFFQSKHEVVDERATSSTLAVLSRVPRSVYLARSTPCNEKEAIVAELGSGFP
ncbi:hypothetical protein BDZ97DRAFT_1762863 [Flammula alnicola]|nr:hypothetical protein BDZ97DRAFT_1762863 [Flammula alnicola]